MGLKNIQGAMAHDDHKPDDEGHEQPREHLHGGPPGRRRWLALHARSAAGVLAWSVAPAFMASAQSRPQAPATEATHPRRARPYRWTAVPFGGGGYVDGLLFHPTQRDLLYCRTDIGGAYRYDPSAQRWIQLLDPLPRAQADLMGVLSLAVDPNDADRLYAACGLYLDPAAQDGAVMASTDRGATWTVHPLTLKLGGNSAGRGSGERLQVDPWRGEVLLLGTSQNGLLRSADRGRRFEPLPFAPRHVSLVLLDPSSGRPGQAAQRIYVGSHDQPGLYLSEDGGQHFQPVAETPAQAPQHAALGPDGVLYVSFALGDGRHVANPSYATTGSVWKRDAQGQWTDITPVRPGTGRQGFGYSGLDVDRQQPGRLVVSTIERWMDGDDLFVSEDGGVSWTAMGARSRHELGTHSWLANYKANTRRPDPMGHWLADVKIDPFNGRRAAYGTGYGVWMTDGFESRPEAPRVPWRFAVDGIEETATLEIKCPPVGATLLAAMGDVSGAGWDRLDAQASRRLFTPSNETNRSIDFAGLAPEILARTSDHCPTGGYVSTDGGLSWRAFGRSSRLASTAQGSQAPTGIVAVSSKGGFLLWAPEGQPALWSADLGRTWSASQGWPASPSARLWPVADRVNEGVFYLHDRASGSVLISDDGGARFRPMLTGLPVVNDHEEAQLIAGPDRARDLWMALPDGLIRFGAQSPTPQRLPHVAQAWMLALGAAAPGARTPALYVWGRVRTGADGQLNAQNGAERDAQRDANGDAERDAQGGDPGEEGFFRSDDAGQTFVRINDAQHQYGRLLHMAAHPREHGVVFIAPHGRGVLVGRPEARA
ncbi:sialidase family protein [Roseateles terrae]|uniref:Sortilin N-terminal domain-containing protein n=1 Tax=Roseateles terrae TaxID=431060 RepID=A0ABR6GMC4_9BURK|nr:sialidase family protein [Roseateles terrae]MBB3193222.1 hypothetical protein [Roseateles terrae]OWQ89563.1 hypothetical protein CDN98_03290 [Roseateles terrae]